jgi:1-phosphofructokinase family hexose kinase
VVAWHNALKGQAQLIAPLIVCVSANPAIDRRLRLDAFAIGRINRAKRAEAFAGGKAAHVAMAARALGARTAWLGFLGGATGDQFLRQLSKFEIDIACVRTKGATRMNLELLESSGRVTEVLEPGEPLDRAEMRNMIETLAVNLQRQWRGAVVVISGSLPFGVSPKFYASLIAASQKAGSQVLLDTSGDALRESLASGPTFVKPNRQEAEELLGRRLRGQAAILKAARELIDRGAKSAALSLGAEGLAWIEGENARAWFARPPHLKAISAVGAGDAAVAGFAVAIAERMSGEAAIRLAAACGAASCLAESPAAISSSAVRALMRKIDLRRIGD